jgi:hypothetical protein
MESKEKIFVEPNHNEMYLCFIKEWSNYCDQMRDKLQQNKINWFEFIGSLDIGISPVKVRTTAKWKYEVVDEKKWFLAKLKYGI